MTRQIFSGFLLLLAMLLLWLSAHDSYVNRINQQQDQLNELLQQGQYHLNWSLRETSDLVTGFGYGWQFQENGLLIDAEAAAVSLAFKEQLLLPKIHRQLSFNWQSAETKNALPKLLLEFSRVDYGVFYYSPPIDVKTGLNHIDLGSLVWRIKPEKQNTINTWQSFPVFNTLVLRFSSKEQSPVLGMLSDIKMLQSSLLKNALVEPTIAAPLNNQLRYQWQSQRFKVAQSPVMQAYFNVSPVLLFGLSLVILLSAFACYPNHIPIGKTQISVDRNAALLVIGLVAMVVWSLQTQAVITLFEHQAWLVIGLFALPPILLYKKWLIAKTRAWPLWLATFFVAVILIGLSKFSVGFIQELPLYLLWALCQQVILGPLVSDYLHDKVGFTSGFVGLLTGVLFATLHLPNQMLMLATFMAGVLWSYSWLRYRNIYANAVSHALLALLFYQTMPDAWLGTARIGLWF